MKPRRVERINSLLQQVISEVIHNEVKNPHLPEFVSITRVEVTNDLQHAKVYVSVIGGEDQRKKAIDVLRTSAGFIASRATKKVTLYYFPDLTFFADDTVDKQMHIDDLLANLELERSRHPENDAI